MICFILNYLCPIRSAVWPSSELSELLMSSPNEDNTSPPTQVSSHVFVKLLDSIIADVASECHRIAKLGLDRNLEEEEEELKLSAQARVSVGLDGTKFVVDMFGQTHIHLLPMKCLSASTVVAGRFAPHLEKCIGKGRKARLKATRNSTASAQNRYSPSSSYSQD
ncbi:SAGA-associated factor 11 [Linum perenne]